MKESNHQGHVMEQNDSKCWFGFQYTILNFSTSHPKTNRDLKTKPNMQVCGIVAKFFSNNPLNMILFGYHKMHSNYSHLQILTKISSCLNILEPNANHNKMRYLEFHISHV